MDDIENVQLLEAHYADGVLTAKFSRLLSTDDGDDVNLTQCVYFLYPTTGGKVFGTSLGKHLQTPAISDNKICLLL